MERQGVVDARAQDTVRKPKTPYPQSSILSPVPAASRTLHLPSGTEKGPSLVHRILVLSLLASLLSLQKPLCQGLRLWGCSSPDMTDEGESLIFL